jgi:DNA-binding GntR family transcriptional regulator
VLDVRGFDQHQRLVALFQAGEFAAFEGLMREHVNGTRASYVLSLKARAVAAG